MCTPSPLQRVVLCSGKVFYDLTKYREENNIDDVYIGRVEQLSPFPFADVKRWVRYRFRGAHNTTRKGQHAAAAPRAAHFHPACP